MNEMLEDLIELVATMYRIGDIEGRAYLKLTGELLRVKQVYKNTDVSAAIALYEAVKAVIDV